MAVRLPIKIIFSSKTVEVSAIANAGYETSMPEILVPLSFAEKQLGVSEGSGKELTYNTAGGETKFFRFDNANICMITDDSKSVVINAAVLASEIQEEVILNDQLVGKLGIDLVNVAEGKWRFSDDPYEKLRDSSPKQLFH